MLSKHFEMAKTLAENQQFIQNLKQAIVDYCPGRLLPNGLVKDCNRAASDITVHIPNTCRVCHRSCGGDYPQNGGGVQMDTSHNSYLSMFAEGCQDGTYGE